MTAAKERHEEARFLSQPMTPKSERRRNSWGSLLMQVPDRGCPSAKCIRSKDHTGPCWPRGD